MTDSSVKSEIWFSSFVFELQGDTNFRILLTELNVLLMIGIGKKGVCAAKLYNASQE